MSMSMKSFQQKEIYNYDQNDQNDFRFKSNIEIVSSQQNQSDDSQQQQRRQQILRQQKAVQQWNKVQNKRDFVMNGGFSFDITDYFKFQQRDEKNREKTFFKYLSQKNYLAWFVLLYSVCSSAMIPPWLMSIKANKIIRISWRCLLQLCILIPFVLFEYRTADTKKKQMYSLRHILYPKHFRKMCIAAFQPAFFVTIILSSIQWTYISHCFVLAGLANFFLSIQRTINGKNGHMQRGGQIMIILGIFMVLYDSYQLDTENATPKQRNVINYLYLTRQWWQRVLADLMALFVGYVTSQLSKQTSDLKEYYPPYLAMLLNNSLICIFTAFSLFFFNGGTFDFDSKFGIFGIFTQEHFTNFLYMSIVLGMGVFVSLVMVSKLFPDPIVPALVMTLQPIISTVLWHAVGVQTMPSAYACLGYIMIIPGLMVILLGNCLFTRTNDPLPVLQSLVVSKNMTAQDYTNIAKKHKKSSIEIQIQMMQLKKQDKTNQFQK